MKTELSEAYSIFEKLMDVDNLWKDPSCTFGGMCRDHNLPRRALDKMILRNLGMSGQELIDKYRYICTHETDSDTDDGGAPRPDGIQARK